MIQVQHPLSAYSVAPTPGLLDGAGDISMPLMVGCCTEHDRLRPEPYFSSAHGSIYYTPRHPLERRRRTESASFPTPLIQPRQRRPHSIHIISYPPGFIPPDLRPPKSSQTSTRKTTRKLSREQKKAQKEGEKERRRLEKERSEKKEKRRSLRSLPPGAEKVGKVLNRIKAVFSHPPNSTPTVTATPTWRAQSRPSSFISFARRLSRFEGSYVEDTVIDIPVSTGRLGGEEITVEEPIMATATAPNPPGGNAFQASNRTSMVSIRSAKSMMSPSVSEIQKPVASGSGLTCSILLAEPNVFLTGFEHDSHSRRQGQQQSSALLRGKLQLNVSKNVKIKSVTLKLVGKARTEWPEGIPPSKTDLFEEQTLRTQSLVFFHAMHEGMWETEYGSQCTFVPKTSSTHHNLMSSLYNNSNSSLHILGKSRNSSTLTAKERKRLSLQSVQSRSFGKGESPFANPVQAKGFKIFGPGTYEYAFELPIDHNQLETTKLQYGSVRWELETMVERAGAFKPNLHGSKEVSIVRLPDQMSLEMTEPISISRHWEDQLHYDIMISGKSFPIGAKIPIAFKLTPLAKVQVHKLKVFVTESIEYWTNDRHVTRKDSGRKILLLEKVAGKPLDKQYEASDIRVLSGGELDAEQRDEARMLAIRRRLQEAARAGGPPRPLPDPSNNLLGELDLGLESLWGSTEIEMNVQLPTCDMMARDKTLRLHPDCSWKNVNIVMRISRLDPDDPAGKRRRHFEISIDSPFTVLNCRATQANTSLPQYSGRDGPAEQRQQMSCGCSDAHPLDPNSSNAATPLAMIEEDAPSLNNSRLRIDSNINTSAGGLPSMPQAAHLQSAARTGGSVHRASSSLSRARGLPSPLDREPRPIHLLRHPSYNPPPFNADDPPPPLPAELMTPPPNYDIIVGTPSVDGMADYFARLAAYDLEQEGSRRNSDDTIGPIDVDPFSGARLTPRPPHEAGDDDSSDSNDDEVARAHRRGRVNVANPRTPGGRLVPSRSLEIERPTVRLDMTGVVRRGHYLPSTQTPHDTCICNTHSHTIFMFSWHGTNKIPPFFVIL
ncbi:hypothetical protein QC761_700280 [Podospora bellae-mahoneyi]|uniref:Arrestin C-terminal-like domain-containing protein n=1 Tax=Podospora bellae-mahoneyi TaxID=2093777 RepID=A0ABR0F8E7_9PEZI|nr:hypothetical protein QC761_700280 [Podospora bellae-mahoneyi]